MSETFTPGPWECHGGKYLPIVAIVNGKSAQIGRAESFGQISDEECEANGLLIASAPDLYAALGAVVAGILAEFACLCDPDLDVEGEIVMHAPKCPVAQAEAALLKARGPEKDL